MILLFCFFCMLQQRYEWTSGSPVGFQQFKHFYYKRAIINYNCSRYDKHGKVGNTCPNSTTIKMSARNILHPHTIPVIPKPICSLMLLSNMREPDWISVSCDESLVNTVICKKPRNYKAQNSGTIITKDKSK